MSSHGATAARRTARGLRPRARARWRSRYRHAPRTTRWRGHGAGARASDRAVAARRAASPRTAGGGDTPCLRGPGSRAVHSSAPAPPASSLSRPCRARRRREARTACREPRCGEETSTDPARAGRAARHADSRPPPGRRRRSVRAQCPRWAGLAGRAPPNTGRPASPRSCASGCRVRHSRGVSGPQPGAHRPPSESSPCHLLAARRSCGRRAGCRRAALARTLRPARSASRTASSEPVRSRAAKVSGALTR